VIISVHIWEVSCWDVKAMRKYNFLYVNDIIVSDESCCDLYRQIAKKLVTEKRILLSLRVKSSEVLTPATVEMVKQFYIYDEISRIMPGMQDNVCVNSEETEFCFIIDQVEFLNNYPYV
jgi:hypothetical protein